MMRSAITLLVAAAILLVAAAVFIALGLYNVAATEQHTRPVYALIEATMHALKHPAYAERYQRTKKRLGKQRGAKVAQVDVARRLCHAIWHMLTRNETFAPRGAAFRLAA